MLRWTRLWRTTTVRLTALFILFFVVGSVLLLGFIAYQSSITIQRQQAEDIAREVDALLRAEQRGGLRGLAITTQRLAEQPGPGIYYLGDALGRMVVGNVTDFPASVLAAEGFHSFNYTKPSPVHEDQDTRVTGTALVNTVILESGLRLVAGRDIHERRGFAAIIFEAFGYGVAGIVLLSVLTGGLTALRVLRRIDSITATSSKIMSGSLSERVPVTRRGDEFDRLATNLNQMLSRIEHLMQGLKQVSDNIAHDLKTPLTRLRNTAEAALRDNKTPDEHREALLTVIAESDQLIRTFNALLMIARAEAGAPASALADTDISEVVADVAELYAPVAEDQGVSLQLITPGPVHIMASRELIAQALVNLVENAIKYGRGEAGGDSISLSVEREDHSVRVLVADRGPGIPASERDHVVERFVRLEKSRTEPGSGLGLSLVSAVAHLHGGTFRIEDNHPGVRAVMTFPVGRTSTSEGG